ncbi:glycosyltransferase family 2 protein [Flavobacterium sp. 245]|uniref:glycosyltransferase family 2 protein n=1 Tax=Flavobacterium sp. 245 TaxID=2512115 RepID=UPI00105DA937|nr:glycosyltransferase family 2 protein [Flavobacterium sp. 245]TDP00877.1 glycosyl transferase family 2 [Flavobacterium sp. 245]
MNDILVSIIIPTYNRANILSQTLDSVLSQTYNNWECIIVDDGSTDNTDRLLAEYCKKDVRFKYYKRAQDTPKGGNVCRNLGFELSKGTFIKWLDSDDLLSDNLLTSQINAVSKYLEKKYILATSKWNYFSDSIDEIAPKSEGINKNYENGFDLISDFGKDNTFLPPHVYLVRRELVIKSGLWNDSLLINQDGEFFTRVLLNTKKIIHAEEGMAYYRYSFSPDNVSRFSTVEKCRHSIISWILIDSYIKLYTKSIYSDKYVENGKQHLLRKISDKEILQEYDWFLGKKNLKDWFLKKKLKIYEIIKRFKSK